MIRAHSPSVPVRLNSQFNFNNQQFCQLHETNKLETNLSAQLTYSLYFSHVRFVFPFQPRANLASIQSRSPVIVFANKATQTRAFQVQIN